jgi:hypothetical protein
MRPRPPSPARRAKPARRANGPDGRTRHGRAAGAGPIASGGAAKVAQKSRKSQPIEARRRKRSEQRWQSMSRTWRKRRRGAASTGPETVSRRTHVGKPCRPRGGRMLDLRCRRASEVRRNAEIDGLSPALLAIFPQGKRGGGSPRGRRSDPAAPTAAAPPPPPSRGWPPRLPSLSETKLTILRPGNCRGHAIACPRSRRQRLGV